MKKLICKYSLVMGITLLSLIRVGTANALNIDYNGNFVDMGTLSSGQHGTIEGKGGSGNIITSQITGYLPSNTLITFSYDFDGTLGGGLLVSGGRYSYDHGEGLYKGYAASISPGASFSGSTIDGVPSEALAFASAQITGSNEATVIIKNYSEGMLNIMNLFFGKVKGSKNYTISYEVSEVPLPAALPMFGMGLVAVAGFRARKKRNNKA